MSVPKRIAKYSWMLILPCAFAIYAVSFHGIPVLERHHSILGEADSAAYIVLIPGFSLTKQYGDPYRLQGRGLNDVAQKHKIHHILYVIVASALYQVLATIYPWLGLPARQALFAINAVLGCISIILLYLLLKKIDPQKKFKVIFLMVYAFSLSSWIFYSVPESWPFSALLALLFLVLLYSRGVNPLVMAVFVGIAMLNNVFLGTLCFFLIIRSWVSRTSLKSFLAGSVGAIALAIVTWLALMTLLSVFDTNFRPDHFFEYTTWFKKHIAPPVIIFDTYFWKSALSQLYITSMVSNQSVPNVPQESLLYTFQQSTLGLAATAVYLTLLATVGWRGARQAVSQLRERSGIDTLLSSVYFPMALYGLAWLFLTVLMDTSGGFLYSTMVVPMIVATLYKFTDWRYWMHKCLWTAVIGAVLINNAQQILSFRSALMAMTQ